jgi:hypothetical protein
MKSTEDLIRVALAGGGMELNGGMKSTEDLVRIAIAASNLQAQIIITGANMKSTEDLVRISLAGKGCVVFKFE